jgi:hypothetical protein
MLARDDNFNFRVTQWGDLHRRLYEALPITVTVLWGHRFLLLAADDKCVRDAEVLFNDVKQCWIIFTHISQTKQPLHSTLQT